MFHVVLIINTMKKIYKRCPQKGVKACHYKRKSNNNNKPPEKAARTEKVYKYLQDIQKKIFKWHESVFSYK